MIFHGRVPEAMRVRGLRFRLNRLRWRLTRRKSRTLRRRATAKTKPTPRRMRRRKPQAIRAPARGSTVIITTTTPDDITAGTVDITPAGTAGNLRRVYRSLAAAAQSISIWLLRPQGTGPDVPSSIRLRADKVIE